MDYLPRIGAPHHNGSIVVDTNIHTNDIIARELDDGVIGHNGEDEYRCAALNLNERQGNLTLTKASIIEVENQTIPRAADNHFEDDFTVDKGIAVNESVLLIDSAKIDGILAIRRRGSIHSTLPALAYILGTFIVCGSDALLPRTILRNYAMPEQTLFT